MTEKKAMILVVDDIMANRKLAGKILADEFLVDCVKSGEEALDFFAEQIPDLVLLDIYMEGIDGFEVMEKMKKNPHTAEIPVIFLTADDDHEVETRGFKAGAVDFITKPFIPAIMLERVRRTIELSRLRENLQDEVKKQTRRIQHLSLQVVQVLVKTMETRSRNVQGHAERVANYAWKIADQLGLSVNEKEQIYYMGLLHEIGKIAIPDALLKKEGPLTEAEEEIIQQTTIMGSEILKEITELPDLWKGARYCREHYDGSGYPEGLKETVIPLSARIIAVASGYDTLANGKDSLPAGEIRQRMMAARGKRYDPEIVDLLVKLLDEGRLQEKLNQ